MAKYWGTPPFFTPNFFFQNDSEWLEMDFKHNFTKCIILTCETPPQCNISYIFFEGVPNRPIFGKVIMIWSHRPNNIGKQDVAV